MSEDQTIVYVAVKHHKLGDVTHVFFTDPDAKLPLGFEWDKTNGKVATKKVAELTREERRFLINKQ